MNSILKHAVSVALAVSAATLTSIAIGQTGGSNPGPSSSSGATTGGLNQPGMPMGPTKAGPNAAVTGSNTSAGNSGSSAPQVRAASSFATTTSTSTASNTASGKSGGKSAMSGRDRRFMLKAAQDGIAEVEIGKLAESNGANADVKAFGQRMQQDHGKAIDELKSIAQSKGIMLPSTTDRTQARLTRQLQALKGDRFDRVYAREAGVKDHKAAVAMFTREVQKGSDPDVRAFAVKTLPTLDEHLRMAQAMHDSVIAPAKK